MVVKVLRWPADSRKREQCEVLGMPRLLVVEGGAALPTCLDALEDWVRPPISQEELRKVRTATLEARARHNAQPIVDPNEMLCFGNRRLQLSTGEAKLMRLFVEHYGCVVPREQLAGAAGPRTTHPGETPWTCGSSGSGGGRAAVAGSIRTIWGRGYLLEAAFPTGGRRPLSTREGLPVTSDREPLAACQPFGVVGRSGTKATLCRQTCPSRKTSVPTAVQSTPSSTSAAW